MLDTLLDSVQGAVTKFKPLLTDMGLNHGGDLLFLALGGEENKLVGKGGDSRIVCFCDVDASQ